MNQIKGLILYFSCQLKNVSPVLNFQPFILFHLLQDLHSQFKKVLTPLVVKNIQSEEPSVTHILKAFNELCQNPELPLQKVAYQIEQDLATVTLGMQVGTDHFTIAVLKYFHQVFKELCFPVQCSLRQSYVCLGIQCSFNSEKTLLV